MGATDTEATETDAIATTAQAMRIVLVLALDRATVGACLGVHAEDAGLWPSTLHAWAAETAARSPLVWSRCARAIDEALAPWMAPFEEASVACLAQALGAGQSTTAMAGHEIAAALWALVRRREWALTPIAARLAMEAEILVARSFVWTGER